MRLFQLDIKRFASLEEYRQGLLKHMNLSFKIMKEHCFIVKTKEEALGLITISVLQKKWIRNLIPI